MYFSHTEFKQILKERKTINKEGNHLKFLSRILNGTDKFVVTLFKKATGKLKKIIKQFLEKWSKKETKQQYSQGVKGKMALRLFVGLENSPLMNITALMLGIRQHEFKYFLEVNVIETLSLTSSQASQHLGVIQSAFICSIKYFFYKANTTE